MVQYSACIILQVWYTVSHIRAFQKKITERVTVNRISIAKKKKMKTENHGPSPKELLKLLFLFLSVKGRNTLSLYMVKDHEV